MANEKEVVFQIREHIGVIATYPTGWTKEVNLVSWNGAAPKYDIRDWDFDHAHMSRGVTLRNEEMSKLIDMVITFRNKKVVENAKSEKKAAFERAKNNPRPFVSKNEDATDEPKEEACAHGCCDDVMADEDGVVLESSVSENAVADEMPSEEALMDGVVSEAINNAGSANAEVPF